jgi:Asp-tRNA(Asn)/Glu-tRNA(Gln) amidotransferase B subunit
MRGRDQSGRRSGARAKIPKLVTPRVLTMAQVSGRVGQAMGQKIDIEHVLAVLRFILGKKIEQERSDSRLLERLGNVGVARAESAAPTSVRKKNDSERVLRKRKDALQMYRIGRNPDLLRLHVTPLFHRSLAREILKTKPSIARAKAEQIGQSGGLSN